jgi:hypothetical protein
MSMPPGWQAQQASQQAAMNSWRIARQNETAAYQQYRRRRSNQPVRTGLGAIGQVFRTVVSLAIFVLISYVISKIFTAADPTWWHELTHMFERTGTVHGALQ